MGRKPPHPRPSDAELEILSVLWERGPSTVRDVFESLSANRTTGYTTILKLMQIMAVKGLVKRREDARAHIYQAAIPREATQRQLISNLVNRAFGGSALQLAQQALASAKQASPDELAEIRRMLAEFERKKS